MDFKTAMAAARAEAESRRKTGKPDEGKEKRRSRSGPDMGLESFDPAKYVSKEKAETASMWLVLAFSITVSLLMRFVFMPGLSSDDNILWLLPLMLVFVLPSLHRTVMPEGFKEHYTKGTWFKASFLHTFTWLAVTFLLVNPPLGDIGAPTVAESWVIVVDDGSGNLVYPANESSYNVILTTSTEGMDEGNTAWLLFAVRDNLDTSNVDISVQISDGINSSTLNSSSSDFSTVTDSEFNSTWMNKLKSEDRKEDLGFAVNLGSLSVGEWDVKVTLSEQGKPWVNTSPTYSWKVIVKQAD